MPSVIYANNDQFGINRYVVMISVKTQKPVKFRGHMVVVAVVRLTGGYAIRADQPKMISRRARGVDEVIHLAEPVFYSSSTHSKYRLELDKAYKIAIERNAHVREVEWREP